MCSHLSIKFNFLSMGPHLVIPDTITSSIEMGFKSYNEEKIILQLIKIKF